MRTKKEKRRGQGTDNNKDRMGTWNGHSKTRNRQRERFGQGKNNDKGIHEDLEWIRTCLWTRTGRRRKIIMGKGKGRATV